MRHAAVLHVALVAGLTAGLTAGLSEDASANVGKPNYGGTLSGDPVGIHGIAIRHEELVLDLRPLAAGRLATISATYHLDNRAGEATLDLVFVGGSDELHEFAATLDGRQIMSAVHTGEPLPDRWRAPATTPSPEDDGDGDGDGDGELDYEVQDIEARGLQLVVPPGAHTLAVSYAADAVHYHHGGLTLRHQLAYVLSPARSWDGFGGLDVTVQIPPGWRAGVTPALAREGDTLHGAFDRLPADAIALTVHAPEGAYAPVNLVAWLVFLGVALGGGPVLWRWIAAYERRRALAGKWPSWLIALGGGAAFSAAFLAAGLGLVFGPPGVLAAGQADHYGYGQALAAVAVVLGAGLVLVVGVGLARFASRRAHLRAAGS
jgi:hypothetical protein